MQYCYILIVYIVSISRKVQEMCSIHGNSWGNRKCTWHQHMYCFPKCLGNVQEIYAKHFLDISWNTPSGNSVFSPVLPTSICGSWSVWSYRAYANLCWSTFVQSCRSLCSHLCQALVEHYYFTSLRKTGSVNLQSSRLYIRMCALCMFPLSLWFFCSVLMLGSGYWTGEYVKNIMSCYVLQNLLSGSEHLPTVGLINWICASVSHCGNLWREVVIACKYISRCAPGEEALMW